MTSANTERRRKSEIMTEEERIQFEAWVNSFPTKTDAKEVLDVNIGTLDRLLLKGSGSPDTIAKVRRAIAA